MGNRLLVLLVLLVATIARAEHEPFVPPDFKLDPIQLSTVGGGLFTATLECETRCAGKEASTKKSIVRTFSAKGRGMKRGNGGYWGSLGWNIQSWSREQCLAHAMDACRKVGTDDEKLAAVASFGVNEIKSGKWLVTEPIDCSERKVSIVSPFGARAGTQYDSKVASTEAGEITRTPVEAPAEKPAKCDVTITADMCFGDCLAARSLIDPEDVETLASTKPVHSPGHEVCGDPLVKALKGKKLSASVIEHYCDQYLWSAVIRGDGRPVGPASCAATRISAHCKNLVDALKR